MKPGDKFKIQNGKVIITHRIFKGRSREITNYDQVTGMLTAKKILFDKVWESLSKPLIVKKLLRRKT